MDLVADELPVFALSVRSTVMQSDLSSSVLVFKFDFPPGLLLFSSRSFKSSFSLVVAEAISLPDLLVAVGSNKNLARNIRCCIVFVLEGFNQ
ncbi:hypothetical protein AcV5_001245 [Taiwanofungus camphoratus]|nr:hypothetical protein AcV5_001245 [Antrodia cinnamomea]